MSREHGLALFDVALGTALACTVPARFDLANVRAAGPERAPAWGGLLGVRRSAARSAAVAAPPCSSPPLIPWVLSAATLEALPAQAEALLRRLTDEDGNGSPSALDVAYSLATTRAWLPARTVVLGTNTGELTAALRAGTGSTGVAADGATAFLFPGHGVQYADMATSLRDRVPMFAVALQKIAAELDPLLDQPLAEILRDGPGERTDHAQAAVFAVQVAVFRLLTTLGVRLDAVAGHSVGELAAAHAAGMFSLADACALVAARGRLMRELGGEGAMVAVQVPEADVPELLRGHEERVAPAAVNGPASVVLAGDAVREISQRVTQVYRLAVRHAFHSHHRDPVLGPFREVLAGLDFRTPVNSGRVLGDRRTGHRGAS
ncbi:polyene macrolide polyketide synthase [Streptomyces sp. MnatMP-M27]|uniref:acyltransferase domain-containing protein n=1 Tax=Streptomyces sp. MnatMP-M27 TaxID=1839768 RepID=UPI00081D6308|nr:acyltransferase domain-containing protein [Streptomyces sp. MnatMP-M27]SCF91659.1 polyene macrolide polyketide synthase [Streptomyces sp. MnatMP-M27]